MKKFIDYDQILADKEFLILFDSGKLIQQNNLIELDQLPEAINPKTDNVQ